MNHLANIVENRLKINGLDYINGNRALPVDFVVFSRLPRFPNIKGLAITIKPEGGKASAATLDLMAMLNRNGWIARVFYGLEHFESFAKTALPSKN